MLSLIQLEKLLPVSSLEKGLSPRKTQPLNNLLVC